MLLVAATANVAAMNAEKRMVEKLKFRVLRLRFDVKMGLRCKESVCIANERLRDMRWVLYDGRYRQKLPQCIRSELQIKRHRRHSQVVLYSGSQGPNLNKLYKYKVKLQQCARASKMNFLTR